MIVPYVETPVHADYLYNCAQQALWNLCLVLRPRWILDIGTMGGTSALLAAQYLERNGLGGQVVTADVVMGKATFEHPLVTRLQVYPHSLSGLQQYPWVMCTKMMPDYPEHLDDSASVNAAMMLEALTAAGGKLFDLAYVDGDHSELGILRDLEIVKRVTWWPHYALLDDVYMPGVPAEELYRESLVHQYDHYDFEGDGWETFKEPRPNVWGMPRMALVWEKG